MPTTQARVDRKFYLYGLLWDLQVLGLVLLTAFLRFHSSHSLTLLLTNMLSSLKLKFLPFLCAHTQTLQLIYITSHSLQMMKTSKWGLCDLFGPIRQNGNQVTLLSFRRRVYNTVLETRMHLSELRLKGCNMAVFFVKRIRAVLVQFRKQWVELFSKGIKKNLLGHHKLPRR